MDYFNCSEYFVYVAKWQLRRLCHLRRHTAYPGARGPPSTYRHHSASHLSVPLTFDLHSTRGTHVTHLVS